VRSGRLGTRAGSNNYLDRVRYPCEQPYPDTTNHVVPKGFTVEYVQNGIHQSLGADDEERDFYVHEAVFMRVQESLGRCRLP